VFKLPAQVAYRGTRGAYRKMKSRRRVGPGMIFSEAGDQQVIEGPLHKWANYVVGILRPALVSFFAPAQHSGPLRSGLMIKLAAARLAETLVLAGGPGLTGLLQQPQEEDLPRVRLTASANLPHVALFIF
jgi:hypothetical protein